MQVLIFHEVIAVMIVCGCNISNRLLFDVHTMCFLVRLGSYIYSLSIQPLLERDQFRIKVGVHV